MTKSWNTKPRSRSWNSSKKEQLTPRDKMYLGAHEHEYRRDRLMLNLIEEVTGLSFTEQGGIIGKAESKGVDKRKLMLERAEPYMNKIAMQLTDSQQNWTLNIIRDLTAYLSTFGDIVYESREARKAKEHLTSV